MALRCFAKCPYRALRWDIRQGAQEGIWRYCGKLPIRGPNHHQLGPYEPGTLAGSAHQVNGVPKPAIYRVNLESRLITEDDMLPVGHCRVPPPLRSLQAETTVVGSQQELRCGSICPVTTGQESVVNRCATSPHSVQNSYPRRQGPSTQETILSDHSQQCTVLPRCCLSGSPWRLAWHQRSSGRYLLSMRLTVARVKPTRAAIAPCLMPSRASANTSCLIPIGVGRGIVRTIRKTFEKICKYWFKVVTVWRLIWGNDHLYCGFGARRSHLTLHWMSAQGSVGFRWGTIAGPYHAN